MRILGQQAVGAHLAHGAVRGYIAVERDRFRQLALMFDFEKPYAAFPFPASTQQQLPDLKPLPSTA
jgi:hypothetical protein